jgi:DNA repair exonuclease SbcCD ATPase subunit
MMAADSQRVDTLLHELDATRAQLREKSQVAERLMLDTTAKAEELKAIPKIMKDLDECRVNFNALQKQIGQEQQEKLQALAQVEHLTTALESAQSELRQREQALQTVVAEAARLNRDVSNLSVKADGIEHISRDNERLKSHVARLETDTLSLTHRVAELTKELEHAGQDTSSIVHDRDALRETLRSTQSRLDAANDQHNALQVMTQSERERRSAAEAALAETRAVLAQAREELQSERVTRQDAQRRTEQCQAETREMRGGLGQACLMGFNAMQEWDDLLSVLLDGEMFSGILRGSSLGGRDAVSFRQAQSSGYAAFRSPTRGGRDSGEDRGVEQLLAMPVDQLLQRVAVRVERVGLKLQRTEKIRSLFTAQAEKLVDLFQQSMQVSQERTALYHHKLVESQGQIHKLRNVVERDRRQRDDETAELMQFKEVVLSQHTAQLRDSELRFAQVTQQLEHEKARSDELQRQVASQSDELRALQQINQRMHEDLAVLERTESIVSDLAKRVGELGDLNRTMSHELDSKADSIMHLTRENGELKLELSSLVARSENLLQQVRSRDEAIETSESKLQGLMREMERLRSRQIHPDLAKTILDTQSILQTAVRGGGAQETHRALPVSAVAPTHTAAVTGDKIGEHLAKAEQLEALAVELISRTAEMVASFEGHLTSTRVTRGAAALSSLKQEVYELLDANSNLAVQLQQLVAEFKKSIRQLNLSMSAHDAQDRQHAEPFEQTRSTSLRAPISPIMESNTARRFDSFRGDSGHSPTSKFGSMTLSSPIKLEGVTEPQYSSSIRNNVFSSTQRLAPSDSSGMALPQTPDAGSYRGSAAKSARFHSTPSASIVPAPNGASSTSAAPIADFPVRIGGYQPSTSFSASMAAYTPTTASRLSTSRLNKLGSDLEALARKLDTYDTSRTK